MQKLVVRLSYSHAVFPEMWLHNHLVGHVYTGLWQLVFVAMLISKDLFLE
jgi:hypothetical protein